MLRMISFLSLLCLVGCSSSKTERGDIMITYVAKNALHNTETRIEVSGEALSVVYHSVRPKRDIQEQFIPETAEIESLHRFLNEIKLHDIQQPKTERMLDVPDEKITATFGGRTSTFSIGSVRDLPEEIVQLRKQIIDLAVKHSPAMKEALGY
ncbi:MAG TPA: hypothetical protein DGH68_09470 [Bacteroidetes bacterium]|nr:hypothetical protein [Bacteroidota bacterium]